MAERVARPRPVDRESEFGADELFFSTTDLVGNVLSGNSVFIRVSQYSKEELLGAPHNIIRHPDMPRVVFKVLWDYLKAKKTVVAYVKNMSKEGRYYWVLASVFIIPKGYLSIRIKPTSDIFKLIPGVYEKMLMAEEKGGMEASLNLLLKILQEKGFDDYDSFMSTILIEELNSRQKLIESGHFNPAHPTGSASTSHEHTQQHLVDSLKEIKTLCSTVTESFNFLFNDFENLLTIEKTLKSNSQSVLNFSEEISILSLNVNINSYYAGETGRTLSVVAKAIKTKTEDIEFFTQSIVKFAKDISTHTQKLGFHTSTPRLQSAMINFFIQEVYIQSQRRAIAGEELDEMKANIMVLINLFTSTFSQLSNLLFPLAGKINDILELINEINSCIYELERSNFLGNIEAALIGEQGVKFNFTFSEIKASTDTIKQRLLEFRKYLNNIIETTTAINTTNAKILSHVEMIKLSVEKLQEVH